MASKFTLSLTGSDIKQSTRTISWSSDEQSENVYKINDVDSALVIDLAGVDDLNLIYISSEDGNFIVKTTIGTNIISEETNLYIATLTSDYVATIDSFELSTSSTTDINIEVNLYGESS